MGKIFLSEYEKAGVSAPAFLFTDFLLFLRFRLSIPAHSLFGRMYLRSDLLNHFPVSYTHLTLPTNSRV